MTKPGSNVRYVVGVMTGTSIDGIDAALVQIEGHGLDIRAKLIRHISRSLGELALPLRNAASQKPITADALAQLAWDFGILHADVIEELCDETPDLICVHGQTIYHKPPISWQLINPAPIANRFNCPIVFDLRQADLAAGGQGAPITPLADWIMFRSAEKSRAIINLGGFCNVTILPKEAAADESRRDEEDADPSSLSHIRGFDVCSCNQLLNSIAQKTLNHPYDEDGKTAQSGTINKPAHTELLALLMSQSKAGRSLGTGDEAFRWIDNHLNQLSPNDLAATAVDAIACAIAKCLNNYPLDELVLAGGGTKNKALVKAITVGWAPPTIGTRKTNKGGPCPPYFSDQFGILVETREAMAMAILGTLTADQIPITLPQITGCKSPAPIAGVWLNK